MAPAFRAAGSVLLALAFGTAGHAAPATPSPPAPAAPASAPKAPPAHVTVLEDDNVRIEEARVRGAPQRITVLQKNGRLAGTSYEIIVPAGGRDPSSDRSNAGPRAWSLFSF